MLTRLQTITKVHAFHSPSLLPGIQMQWNPPIWSRQVASLWHGLDIHSLTSISQRGPSYPCRHLHWKDPLVFRQRPPCSQGLAPKTFNATQVVIQTVCGSSWVISVEVFLFLILTKGTLVNIQVAGRPRVTWGTGADCFAIDWVGVTVGPLLTWVTDAGVIKVAQQTCEA